MNPNIGSGENLSIILQLILSRLDNIDHSINDLSKTKNSPGKTWLKPAEFASIAGVTTKTLRRWVADGRFSEKAHRQVKQGAGYVNQFHNQLALSEMQRIQP